MYSASEERKHQQRRKTMVCVSVRAGQAEKKSSTRRNRDSSHADYATTTYPSLVALPRAPCNRLNHPLEGVFISRPHRN